MSLFRFALEAFLQIERPERDTLKALASSAERTAIALEAIVLKLNEPDVPQATTLEITAGTPTPQQGA